MVEPLADRVLALTLAAAPGQLAALLLDLCRATDPSVRSSAEGVLRHLQAEAQAERARTDPAYTRRQAEPRAAAEVRGSRVGARGEEHVPAEDPDEEEAERIICCYFCDVRFFVFFLQALLCGFSKL